MLHLTVSSADGNFIETSSGPAARELKRRYDQLAGVGPSVRSPYAITAFVSQHGKSMYRIGFVCINFCLFLCCFYIFTIYRHRDEHSAPGASAAELEERITLSKSTTSESSHSPRGKRNSRLSMHFLPPMFAKSNVPPPRPQATSSNSSVSKKLRKTRSSEWQSTDNIITSGPTFTVTGRGHSQSVTAMDNTRPSMTFSTYPAPKPIDAFAELLNWFASNNNSSSNFSTNALFNPGKVSADHNRPRATISLPFGRNVSFDPPAYKPPVAKLVTPRHLREMQSFESGLTVTIRPDGIPENLSDRDSPVPGQGSDNSRPSSAIRLSMLSSAPSISEMSSDDLPSEPPETDMSPSAEALRLSSHYSTEVFNVLQTYRGLPLFEKIVPESETTAVIKLSLSGNQDAAPRDDPRFVIWGTVLPENNNNYSTSRDSLTDLSNPSTSSISKRRGSKVSKVRSPEVSNVELPASAEERRVILAATIERWIAQLTSGLNYDELLNFFLTYRTYVSGVDLCHLLICRFHWALQQASSAEDEVVRRIVRVRTFVAIRYWMLTFFTVDFIPNRELRLLIADWLNTLLHDPIMKKRVDAAVCFFRDSFLMLLLIYSIVFKGIVRRLIRVAKDCKRIHIRATEEPELRVTTNPAAEAEAQRAGNLLGKSFGEAVRKAPTMMVSDTESELDLDFLPDEAKLEETAPGFPSDPANAHLSAGHAKDGTLLSSSRPVSALPISSYNILHRTEHAPPPNGDDLPFVHNYADLPLANRHSALSRAFVRTIGRLGRWKRALNAKPVIRPAPLLPSGPVSVFNLDVSPLKETQKTINGEHYMLAPKPISPPANMTHMQGKVPHSPAASLPSTLPPVLMNQSIPPISHIDTHSTALSGFVPDHSESFIDAPVSIRPELPPLPPLPTPVENDNNIVHEETDMPPIPVFAINDNDSYEDLYIEPTPQPRPESQTTFNEYEYSDRLAEPDRPQSFLSTSTDSFGAILTSDGPLQPTFPGEHRQWQFDVVSIDELGSDAHHSLIHDDGPMHPPGLRKPAKKLPTRHDFEFVRRSEVSSMGIISHESMRDSMNGSTHSSPSSSGMPGPINRFQMKSLRQAFESDSNDGEEGDVEAALRKLEGQINPKVMQENAEKVDVWVRSLQERMANGDYGYESSIYSEDEVEGFIDEAGPLTDDTDVETPPELVVSTLETTDDENSPDDFDGMPHTPIPSQNAYIALPPGLERPARIEAQKPPPEDVVPLEILQSRLDPSEPVTNISDDTPRFQQPFILTQSGKAFAEHFAMIDRELFMGVKFEELVSEDWSECKEINVLDWAQYLKDRARWKAEGLHPEKTTALAAVRARFNLMVNFVVSEVVMSQPSQRHLVVGKLIKVAWVRASYSPRTH